MSDDTHIEGNTDTHLPLSEKKQENHTPFFLQGGFVYAFIVFFVGILICLWCTYAIQKEVRTQAQTVGEKIQLIEKYDGSVEKEKSQFIVSLKKLENPFYFIAFWETLDIKNTITSIHTSLETRYQNIKKEQTDILLRECNGLKQKLSDIGTLSLPSKTETQVVIQRILPQIEAFSLEKIFEYQAECSKRKHILHTELLDTFSGYLSHLESILEENKGIDFPSKDEAIAYIYTTQEELRIAAFDDNILLERIKEVKQKTEQAKQEIEQTKRALVFAIIENFTYEADNLYAFFTQRPGYTDEVQQIEVYKSTLNTFYSDAYKDKPADEIEKEAEEQLFPLLDNPRQRKAVIEEEERKALIAQQRQAGIPEAPIKEGKVIVVSVPNQRLYAYENGVSFFQYSVPVTTGKAGYDTVRGTFRIYHKATNFRMRSPFPDEWYDNVVTYWMPFYQGYGLHDAYWRSVYGTQDYPYVGSHGCVNVPFAEVEQLFYWAEIGTPVIVR